MGAGYASERLLESEEASGYVVTQPPYRAKSRSLLSAEDYQRLVHNIEAAIRAESKATTMPSAAK